MTTTTTERCPACGMPVQTRTTQGGRRLVLDTHGHQEPAPDTYVLLPDGTVMTATQGMVHVYRVHRCRKGA